jgi:acetoacetyl-CoA synthetase
MNDMPLWSPSEDRVASANITAFIALVNERHRLAIRDYAGLHQWSIDRIEDFWTAVWDFCGVVAETRGSRVLADGDKMPGARFFPDAKLNFAENLLRNPDDSDAIVFWGEDDVRRHISRR